MNVSLDELRKSILAHCHSDNTQTFEDRKATIARLREVADRLEAELRRDQAQP